jgi:hypothetical protein
MAGSRGSISGIFSKLCLKSADNVGDRDTLFAEKSNHHSLVMLHLPRQKTEMHATIAKNFKRTRDMIRLRSFLSYREIGITEPVNSEALPNRKLHRRVCGYYILIPL